MHDESAFDQRSQLLPLLLSLVPVRQANHAMPDQLPTAEEVMARVAANQDTAEAERAHYVYVQHAKMTSRRGKTVMCEEITDYRFTPSTDGTDEQLLKVDGRFLRDKKYVTYTALLPRDEDKPKDPESKDKDKDKNKDKNKKRTRRTRKTRTPPSIPTATKPSIATSSKTCAGT